MEFLKKTDGSLFVRQFIITWYFSRGQCLAMVWSYSVGRSEVVLDDESFQKRLDLSTTEKEKVDKPPNCMVPKCASFALSMRDLKHC